MWKVILKYGTNIIQVMSGYALVGGKSLQNLSIVFLRNVYFLLLLHV